MLWTHAMIAGKMAQIERLPENEIRHWHACVTGRSPFQAANREPFPGELEALIRRAIAVGVDL